MYNVSIVLLFAQNLKISHFKSDIIPLLLNDSDDCSGRRRDLHVLKTARAEDRPAPEGSNHVNHFSILTVLDSLEETFTIKLDYIFKSEIKTTKSFNQSSTEIQMLEII